MRITSWHSRSHISSKCWKPRSIHITPQNYNSWQLQGWSWVGARWLRLKVSVVYSLIVNSSNFPSDFWCSPHLRNSWCCRTENLPTNLRINIVHYTFICVGKRERNYLVLFITPEYTNAFILIGQLVEQILKDCLYNDKYCCMFWLMLLVTNENVSARITWCTSLETLTICIFFVFATHSRVGAMIFSLNMGVYNLYSATYFVINIHRRV